MRSLGTEHFRYGRIQRLFHVESTWILLILVFAASSSLAQQAEPDSTFTADTALVNYKNLDVFGGPNSIGAQMYKDYLQTKSLERFPLKFWNSWYEWKAKVEEKTGLQYSIDYSSVFIRSSTVLNDTTGIRNAGGGILDIHLGWNLVGRKSGKNKGILFVGMAQSHAYGTSTPPAEHGISESGYYGMPATDFEHHSIRISELNWQQTIVEGWFDIVLGKIDAGNYFNVHMLDSPSENFLGVGSSASGTINFPNQGLGIVAGVRMGKHIFMHAGLTDVYGDQLEDGDFLDFGNNFFDGNFFIATELGYATTTEERYEKRVTLTFWLTNAYTNPAGTSIKSAKGIAFSSNWLFNGKFAPYFRFGFSDGHGENATYKKDIQLGHAFLFGTGDQLGTAFSWAETNIAGAKKQMTAEIYYRFDLNQNLSITPDFQLIWNPALNPDKDMLTYWGIRGRMSI